MMPAENATNLPNLIRKKLALRGMTQEEFAARLNVSTTTVSRWVRGKAVPTLRSLSAISLELGIPITQLQMPSNTRQIGRPKGILLEPFMVRIIEERRSSLGLTNNDLSYRAGVSSRSISRILRGSSTRVQRETLIKIANAMDLSLYEILRSPKGSARPIPKTNRRHPVSDQTPILPRRNVRPVMETARKKKTAPEHLRTANPIPQRIARVFRDFELHGSIGLALDDRNTFTDPVIGNEINDFQTDEITAAQFAVDREVEQCQGSKPGKPQQNANIERYNRTVRNEWPRSSSFKQPHKWGDYHSISCQ
jgi:transcriptional regulator with XRE-family HTH domain